MTVRSFLRAEWCPDPERTSIFSNPQTHKRVHRARKPSHKRANCSVAAMILSVPRRKKRTESFWNRTSAVWDRQVYTLRTSFKPCHCQFRAHNDDSWRIGPNIETYLLLLLSPSDSPHFSLPSFLSPCSARTLLQKYLKLVATRSLAALLQWATSRATEKISKWFP